MRPAQPYSPLLPQTSQIPAEILRADSRDTRRFPCGDADGPMRPAPFRRTHRRPWPQSATPVRQNIDQYPRFAGTYTFSAKEKDTETGYSYFGSRYYSSDLSIWLSVDPMAGKYPSLSPYTYCADNPVKLVDPNGMEYGDYYNYAGEYLGSDKIDDNKVYVAKSKTDVVNEDGTTTTSFIEAVDLGITHDEFCIIANIIKKESSHANNEDLWLAHTANNAAKKSKMSLYKKLMSGYSSVNFNSVNFFQF